MSSRRRSRAASLIRVKMLVLAAAFNCVLAQIGVEADRGLHVAIRRSLHVSSGVGARQGPSSHATAVAGFA